MGKRYTNDARHIYTLSLSNVVLPYCATTYCANWYHSIKK